MVDDPQRALKLWLAAKVAPHGMISKLSAATGISNDKLTRSKELEATDPKKRRQLKQDEIRAIADFFGEVPPGFNWVIEKSSPVPASDTSARIQLTDEPQKGGRPDLAVRGIALGGKEGDGDFQLNGDALDYIARPAGLINRPKAYAVILRNTSMEPAYKHGWPVFIDEAGRKPVEGEDVLVELHGEDGEPGAAFIKTLVSQRGGQVVLTQYNSPPADGLRFPTDRVKQILRVIPYVEAMGLSV